MAFNKDRVEDRKAWLSASSAFAAAGPPGEGVSAHSEPSGTSNVGLQEKVTETAHAPPPRGAAASAEVTHSDCP